MNEESNNQDQENETPKTDNVPQEQESSMSPLPATTSEFDLPVQSMPVIATPEEVQAETKAEEKPADKKEEAAEQEAPQIVSSSNPNMKWYVVHTYSMYEDHAKRALLERIKQFGVTDKIGQVFVPKTVKERLLKSGKKKRMEKTSFPGYMLVEMIMDEKTNHVVRDTPKVTGFVGNVRNPKPISEQEVLRLTSPDSFQEQAQQAAATLSFEKGEAVKVTDGAFTNFDGVVDAVQADRKKLRILVSIFGRETPVELEYHQVEKIS